MAFWHFGRLRAKGPTPEVLARQLYDDFVAHGVGHDLRDPDFFEASEASWPALAARLSTYRKALVLFALLRLAPSSPKVDEVALAYGRLIFGSGDTARGRRSIIEVEAARLDIERLVQADSVSLTWAKEWLGKIGIVQGNPVALSRVCIHFLDITAQAVEAAKEISLA